MTANKLFENILKEVTSNEIASTINSLDFSLENFKKQSMETLLAQPKIQGAIKSLSMGDDTGLVFTNNKKYLPPSINTENIYKVSFMFAKEIRDLLYEFKIESLKKEAYNAEKIQGMTTNQYYNQKLNEYKTIFTSDLLYSLLKKLAISTALGVYVSFIVRNNPNLNKNQVLQSDEANIISRGMSEYWEDNLNK